jgi:hypothetical protein
MQPVHWESTSEAPQSASSKQREVCCVNTCIFLVEVRREEWPCIVQLEEFFTIKNTFIWALQPTQWMDLKRSLTSDTKSNTRHNTYMKTWLYTFFKEPCHTISSQFYYRNVFKTYRTALQTKEDKEPQAALAGERLWPMYACYKGAVHRPSNPSKEYRMLCSNDGKDVGVDLGCNAVWTCR